ncbi:toll/interleukin-1 receptor domain-containing protein [Moritella sp. F3]|uniref:toll/interleukin-1 receptor domain-containing protein n=1 Tax=Moritella sp. F3 TaxID=2718882 RepID=UPI0018E0EEBB|nr:toll/interleukin-1 receptor domain-containing protein [Moritella sp. F3]GIC79340.1 hypothetical protein FMO001_40670 [Moritella sp. F1]GIC84059.1 hypothetical protein FMO003_43390 [Moritella sp. F3]
MISNSEKVRLLKKLLTKAELVKVESSSDPEFKTWKNLVERTFVKIFGDNSTEYKHFSKLYFFFQALMWTSSSDFTADHLRVFRQDFNIAKSSILQYIEEIEEQIEYEAVSTQETPKLKKNASKVFISHASKDSSLVEEVIELLESIGLESHQIFCTSFDGYGIGLGENFLDKIKDELSSDTIVLFILSKNFYSSPVCLCEMGATWVLAKEHIPIVVPPLDYSDVSGVIPLTQGMKINEPLKLNLLKEKISKEFGLSNAGSLSSWERKRDRVLARITKLISMET